MATSTAQCPVSPQALAPAASSTTNKVPLSPSLMHTPSIFTNKEWVVPPRPKPGRKPAADTPPTKRKAQNRAAQRAFRERRAARVGELEEQMQQMEEEDERERESLHSRIQQLETNIDQYSRLVVSWSAKCQSLEEKLSKERQLRRKAEEEVTAYRGAGSGDHTVVPIRSRNAQNDMHIGVCALQNNETIATSQQVDTSIGCGKCSIETRCECIDQAFENGGIANDLSNTTYKRPHSPMCLTKCKKSRQSPIADVKPEEEVREIDFTEQFSSKRPVLAPASTNSLAATLASDPCGFCQDGTACICAEMAAEERPPKDIVESPASHVDSDLMVTSSNPCANGPGSCQQCRSDANSTLFCKSLAASRNRIRGQLPAQQYADASSRQAASSSQTSNQQAITGISLSCADAYATLSRHPAYEQASLDPGAWLPSLATIPGGAERPAFEVEAASVMQTLRFFDRRFGRDT